MADVSSPLSPPELARYSRQILLPGLGTAGQRRLRAGRVLVIGAGGLGSPAALYLAAAGVGTLGLADFDRVEEHNLHRQLLHDTAAVGRPKLDSATERLRALNPHVAVVAHGAITADNAVATFAAYDVIVDGTDNFAARYVNNDAACLAGRPLVHASVYQFEGQVTTLDPARGGPCYRCLFPRAPGAGEVPNCGEAGVLGAVCGVVGSLQALEALKLLTGLGEPLRGRLLRYDGLQQRFDVLRFTRDPACPLCGDTPSIHAPMPPVEAPACVATPTIREDWPAEVTVAEAERRLRSEPGRLALLDVREPWETEICRVPSATAIPLRDLPHRRAELPADRPILVMCHHGSRSRRAADYLRSQGFTAINVAGGIDAWAEQIDPSLRRY